MTGKRSFEGQGSTSRKKKSRSGTEAKLRRIDATECQSRTTKLNWKDSPQNVEKIQHIIIKQKMSYKDDR